jgi:hypothetical protein
MNRSNTSSNYNKYLESAAEPVEDTQIGYFIMTTAVSVFLFFVVSLSLQQYPRYLPNPDALLASGWIVVTDQKQTFTFNLPIRWEWEEQHGLLANDLVVEQMSLETAVSLFAEIDDQLHFVLFAHGNNGTDHPGFVIVAHNQRMRLITPEHLINHLQNNSQSLLNAEINTLFNQTQATLYTELVQPDNLKLLCFQRFIPTSKTGYLIVGCAARTEFSNYSDELESIVKSFQTLQQNQE